MNRNIFFAILLVGITVRAIGITSEALWCDEVLSLIHVEQNFSELYASLFSDDVHPPLYFILLRGWCCLFGSTALASRLLSLVLGVFCLPLAYALGKRLLDERSSLLATLFLALSPIHVFYAQEARAYTLFALLVLLAIRSLIDALEKDRARDWVLLSLWNGALLYTHYTSFVFIFCELAAAALSRPSRTSYFKLAASLLISGAMFAPWAGTFISQAGRFRSAVTYQTWGYAAPAEIALAIKWLLYGKEGIILYTILTLWALAASPRESLRKLYLPLLFSVGPFFLLVISSWTIAPMLAGRFLLGTLPFFFLMAAAGLIGLVERIARPEEETRQARAFMVLVVLLAVTIHGKYLYNQVQRADRIDLRPVALHLKDTADPETLIVVIPDHHFPVLRYYLQLAQSSRAINQAIAVFRGTPVHDLRERLESELRPGREIILVYCASEAPEAKKLQDYFEQSFRMIGRETFERVDVFRYAD